MLEAGRLEDAVRIMRCAVECNPASAPAWNDMGILLEAMGNPMEAVRCYRRALRVEPHHREARQTLGLLTLELNMAQELHRQALTSSMAY